MSRGSRSATYIIAHCHPCKEEKERFGGSGSIGAIFGYGRSGSIGAILDMVKNKKED